MVDRKPSSCKTVSIRGISYNLRRWGPPGAPPIVFLHGTQDSSVTFQFVVDALAMDWSIIAPDWRGHGHTGWVRQGYWLHEFVADLDALMDVLFPSMEIPIVGHSLGGNIASIYAGLRPDRLSHLVSLDGFGLLINRIPVDMASVLRGYLDAAKRARTHVSYASVSEMAERLLRANPRLTVEQADFLAEHSSRKQSDGSYCWLFDPDHQRSLPTLHGTDEWVSIWSRIEVPMCLLSSTDSRPGRVAVDSDEFQSRARAISRLTHLPVAQTGHNIHHDAPAAVARAIESFVTGNRAPACAGHRV